MDTITTIKPKDSVWTVSVRNARNPLEQWWKRFDDGLEAHSEAYRLRLIKRTTQPSASALAVSHRYYSEDASLIDPADLLASGFIPRNVEFRYRTVIGSANVGGELLRQFDNLPAPGETITLNEGMMVGTFRVRGVSGPYELSDALQIWIELEKVE